MILIRTVFRSTVGKKIITAATGAFMIGFVFIHLIGNLQIFLGPDAMNSYAATLQSLGPVKWIVRGLLAAAFIIHISISIILNRQNASARPVKYEKESTIRASFASRTMALSGLTILAFVLYHLMHYTLGTVHPEYFGKLDHLGRHDVYWMMVQSFSVTYISAAYIIAVTVLSLHLRHAFASMFQTLGWTNARLHSFWNKSAAVFSILIFIGFTSIPAAVLAGILKN